MPAKKSSGGRIMTTDPATGLPYKDKKKVKLPKSKSGKIMKNDPSTGKKY